ncbi:unnamed protein product [Symbiodinium necroappetens]|uniref:Peroxin-13 n=1 Tax=Symbiodinium necroappetens TaxID=1628268 RepID=A0A812ZVD8_9DINO|nr:unnamed protein product [Symbiodinium necroappetens]
MYGGYGGGMYGRSMYGGYGGMGSMYGGYGGMYGGGMYGGMMGGMGMGMGSSYAESMFHMTQMLEMNSIMLEQLQEHVTTTFYRLRDVGEWIWALKSTATKSKELPAPDPSKPKSTATPSEAADAPETPLTPFASREDKDKEIDRIKRRFKALLVLFGFFLFLVFRDNRRQQRRLLQQRSWSQSADGAMNAAATVATALPIAFG